MGKDIIALLHSDKAKNSLQQVVRVVVPNNHFKTVKTLENLTEECLNSPQGVNTVFIESGLPLEQLSKSIGILKENTKPNNIVLIVGEANANEKVIAQHLSIGINGILSMPFSEDSVREVIKVSEELSLKGSIARLKVSTGLQIKSHLETEGEKFKDSSVLKAVKRACKMFETANPGHTLENITHEYAKLDPKDRLGRNIKDIYQGVSNRVRKIVEKKKNEEIKK